MAFSVCLSGWTLIIIKTHISTTWRHLQAGAGQVWVPLVMFIIIIIIMTIIINIIIIISHQDPLASLKVTVGRGAGQVWVPLVMFLNTPATDMSLMDAQTALTVARRGHFTMSSLHMLDQANNYYLSLHSIEYIF